MGYARSLPRARPWIGSRWLQRVAAQQRRAEDCLPSARLLADHAGAGVVL